MQLAFLPRATAIDFFTFALDGKPQTIEGELLLTAKDGGALIQTRDGTLWNLEPAAIQSHRSEGGEVLPYGQDQMAERLLAELPAGFQTHTTAHFIVCYDTSKQYAMWCGGLFERLYRAFTNYWQRRGFELHEPKFPLPVIIFSRKSDYTQFTRDELGDAAGSIVAYYSLRTNRVLMYDLTGVESLRAARGQTRGLSIQRLLMQPSAEPLVATIVHEATHQISFNCGLQTRYADNPLWLSEGLAIYFESPDMQSSRGWRGIGRINHRRLALFRENLPSRPPDALAQLIATDESFRSTTTGASAYAEAWALTYYLIRTRPKEYVAYVKLIQQKPQLVWDEPETRLSEFRQVFGDDFFFFLSQLDDEFRSFMGQLK